MKKTLSRFIFYWLPLLAWMAMIFYLSSIPNLRISPDNLMDLLLRKLVHFSFFYILYVLSFRAINLDKPRTDFWLPLGFSALYALSDELHQRFVPTRGGNLVDWLIDLSGIIFAYYMIRYHRLLSVFNKYLSPEPDKEEK